ncbi:CaiB/BaiF CoA transferase family protein [Gymnodinialimonas ulvae]|uniref:CaiB/BaiF CoA transferase family protein n=1 Tax=Gymnodinialimonas ulvae TaxID=3126504 RepID=UPI0030A22200
MTRSDAPLSDILVIDRTHVLAGPYCTQTLCALGARIIKVERPGTGDDTRAFPPFVNGESAYFRGLNHGKQSIALNLKSDDDRAIFDRLLARADVILENDRPGVMERLGYGWGTLHARYPRLIYGAVSGFGQTGPEALKPAYDMVVQARGGVMSMTGEAGRDPVRVGASIGDIVAGMALGQGLLAALYDRTKTGLGQLVDVAMLDCQLAILEHAVAMVSAGQAPPGPSGARHPSITPFETFHAADGLFVIAAGNDMLFARLAETLGHRDWADDPRFSTNPARCDNARLLKRMIELETLHHPIAHWIATLEAAGVPTGPIQNVAEAMHDPQIRARNMVIDVLGQVDEPPLKAAGNPIKMSRLPDPVTRPPAPALDGDRSAILAWLEETGGM